MSRSFFGIVSTTPTFDMLLSKQIYNVNETSDPISIKFDKGTGETYSYQWVITDSLAIIKNANSSSAVFTNTGIPGKSTIYCKIYGNNSNNIFTTNNYNLYWNSLNAQSFTVFWSIPQNTTIEYNGTEKYVDITTVVPKDATYIFTTYTGAVNAGDIATSTVSGVINYTGNYQSPTITILPKSISLSSTGSIDLLWNGSVQSISYSVIGSVPQDTNYNVSNFSGIDCNIYTALLTTTSKNYILGISSLTWRIVPTTPSNFIATVSADHTQITLSWNIVSGCTYIIYNSAGIQLGTTNNTYWTTPSIRNTTYTFYIVATCISGTSNRSRVVTVVTGNTTYSQITTYDSGFSLLSPCCLTGNKTGDIGLLDWVQGTNGIIITSITVQNCVCNFSTSLLSGSAARNVKWNINKTISNFPFSNSSSAPNPYTGPITISVPTNLQIPGTVLNYRLQASGTGWSMNNNKWVSGPYWFSAEWKNTGMETTIIPATDAIIT